MASPSLMSLTKSPLLSYVPDADESALKHAFYNTAANLFLVLVCVAAVAVYYVLEAFLRPLLWACLIGTVLHPVKHTLTSMARTWLNSLSNSSTPVLVGCILLPFQVVDKTTDHIVNIVCAHLRPLLAVILGLPAVYFMYYFGPLYHMLYAIQVVFLLLYHLLGYFSAKWAFTLVIGYSVVVVFYWNNKTIPILRALSVPVLMSLLYLSMSIANMVDILRVPIFLVFIVMIAVGFWSEYREAKKIKERQDIESSDVLVSPIEAGWDTLKSVLSGHMLSRPVTSSYDVLVATDDNTGNVLEETDSNTVDVLEKINVNKGQTIDVPQVSAHSSEEDLVESDITDSVRRPVTLAPLSLENINTTVSQSTERQVSDTESSTSTSAKSSDQEVNQKASRMSLSDQCFIGLFWAFVLVQLWMHLWVLQLLPVALAIWTAKLLFVKVKNSDQVKSKLWQQLPWLQDRKDVLVPLPVQGLMKLVIRGDRKIAHGLETALDKLISIFIILMVLIGAVLITVIFAVQLHQESLQIIKMTSNVLNKSLHPETNNSWIPKSNDMQNAMESVVGNAYVYGRSYIATKAKVLLSDDNINKTMVEQQMLEVWDRLYETYFAKSTSTPSKASKLTRRMSVTNLTQMWHVVTTTEVFKARDVMSFIQENIDIVKSVLESLWVILKGNLNIAFSLSWALASLLFGGGTAIMNFAISVVIFLTTLFYLIASSGDQYKPVELVVNMYPTQSGNKLNKLGEAVEEGISGVFKASLKMAAFYGTYTWLIHTVFGISIIVIPSAMATLFAAVPFLGTYWASVPGVIELWLISGEGLLAVVFGLSHLLPTYFVDTAIYSDIKGGGHPYLTGLAIGGGMYCFGLEGAIIGPILLCCLIVAINVYGSMLQTEPEQKIRHMSKRPHHRKVHWLNRALSLSDAS